MTRKQKNRFFLNFTLVLLLLVVGSAVSNAKRQSDPLPSWNDGVAKNAIVDFVRSIVTKRSPNFVPVNKRIAAFDNDGTLWAEQPMYFQLLFALDRVNALAPQHPEWKTKEPFASLLKGDVKGALAGGERAMLEIVMSTHANMTTEEFEQIVKDWLAAAKHPTTKRLYTQMVYQPMLELLSYLRENGFKTFIVSGGGIEFMRPWTEKIYGIPPEQVVGSSIKTKFELRDGKPVLVRLPEINFIDDKQRASPWASTSTSVDDPFSLSATPTATFRCSSGQRQDMVHGSWALFTTPMPNVSGPTTGSHISAIWTRHLMKLRKKAGPWWT